MIFGGYNHIKKMYLKSPHKIDRKFWVYSTELYLFHYTTYRATIDFCNFLWTSSFVPRGACVELLLERNGKLYVGIGILK